jgi:hypothetical protein
MTALGKDSIEVIKFMALFARLKTFVDDDPTDLVSDAIRDESVRDLCEKLGSVAGILRLAEGEHPEFFSSPVDPGFIATWRDYERRYSDAVEWISCCVLLRSLGIIDDDGGVVADLSGDRLPRPTMEEAWQSCDSSAVYTLEKVKDVLVFMANEVESDVWDDREDQLQELEGGLAAWKHLIGAVGLDLQGILRRRGMVPFVLVPRKIGNQQGSSERTALMLNLQEAQNAFVNGTLTASVVLLRATVEVVLKEHHKAMGKDLTEMIDSMRNRLPSGVTVRELHELRSLANRLLHAQRRDADDRLDHGVRDHELKVVKLLVMVRALVEAVK